MSTRIPYCDETWNPVVGCSEVSAGCYHCYARGVARRGLTPLHQGLLRIDGGWTGEVRVAPEEVITRPLRWRQPRRVLVPSMGDLFHPAVPTGLPHRLLMICASLPQHTFLWLTKRASRLLEWAVAEVPTRSVILGVTIEDQTATHRLDPLAELARRGWRTWISAEPLLGPVNLRLGAGGVAWVAVGGETGPRARPCDPAWVADVVDQCAAAAVPCFVKQLGTASGCPPRPDLLAVRELAPRGADLL